MFYRNVVLCLESSQWPSVLEPAASLRALDSGSTAVLVEHRS
jgi:hypothetical protein